MFESNNQGISSTEFHLYLSRLLHAQSINFECLCKKEDIKKSLLKQYSSVRVKVAKPNLGKQDSFHEMLEMSKNTNFEFITVELSSKINKKNTGLNIASIRSYITGWYNSIGNNNRELLIVKGIDELNNRIEVNLTDKFLKASISCNRSYLKTHKKLHIKYNLMQTKYKEMSTDLEDY
jgi:hypothetical protein